MCLMVLACECIFWNVVNLCLVLFTPSYVFVNSMPNELTGDQL